MRALGAGYTKLYHGLSLFESVPSPSLVDKDGKSAIRFAPIPARPSVCCHNRCLLSRLGRSPTIGGTNTGGAHVNSSRSLDSNRVDFAHQPAGVDSAVWLSLKHFENQIKGKWVQIKANGLTDNDPMYTYIRPVRLHKQDPRSFARGQWICGFGVWTGTPVSLCL